MSVTITKGVHARVLTALILIPVISTAGCATFSADGGFGSVETEVQSRLETQAYWLRSDEDREAAREKVSGLLGKTLSAEDAVQVALLNNPELQAAYGMLGVAEAERVQAGRLPNPEFSYSNTSSNEGQEIERSLGFAVGAILTMPLRVAMETRRFNAAKLAAAADAVDTALSTRRTYFEAVAARQLTEYMRQVVDAAKASTELTQRMARVGMSSKMELAREELFLVEANMGLARAVQHETATREALIRALGLWGEQLNFTLPEQLPDLPANARDLTDIEK
ncbi:MAG: TolC family protein, partial [Gammaproteobacteria bacterium]